MLALGISIVALFIGAWMYHSAAHYKGMLAFFDAFILVVISGLFIIHLLPASYAEIGFWALIASGIGLALPLLFHIQVADKRDGTHSKRWLKWLYALAVLGLVFHTLLDGLSFSLISISDKNIFEPLNEFFTWLPWHSTLESPDALSTTSHLTQTSAHHAREHGAHSFSLLALGVLLHRLPIGIMVAFVVVPRAGKKPMWLIIVLMAISTLLGYIAGIFAVELLPLSAMYFMTAMIAAMLLHVVFHTAPNSRTAERAQVPQILGLLLGVGILFLLSRVGGHDHASETPLLSVIQDWFWRLSPWWLLAAGIIFIASVAAPKYIKIKSYLNKLNPSSVPALEGGPAHYLQCDALLLSIPILGPLAGFAFFAARLLMDLSMRWILNREGLLPEDRERAQDCGHARDFRGWLVQSNVQFVVGIVVLSILEVMAQTSFCFVANHPLIASALLAMLGSGIRLNGVFRIFIMAYLLSTNWPMAGVIGFGLASALTYDWDESTLEKLLKKNSYYKVLFIRYAILLGIVFAIFTAGDFWQLFGIQVSYDIPFIRIAVAIFVAITFVILLNRGPRYWLNALLQHGLHAHHDGHLHKKHDTNHQHTH